MTEKRFDFSMNAPITMTSLRERLGFSLDMDFAMSMLWGEVHIPANVDNATTIVIEEIIRLFQAFHKGHAEVSLGADESDITGDVSARRHPWQYLQRTWTR
jgi:hypothetical protein